MGQKRWLTKKEVKELYGMSDNKLKQVRDLNLVETKLDTKKRNKRGRTPFLYRRSQINAFKTLKPKEIAEVAMHRDYALSEFNKQVGKDGIVHSERKTDIEVVVEAECEDRYEYTYVQTVDHPSHYNKTSLEVIDAIDAWDLDFSEGNIIKYLLRAKHKKNAKEDLEKCLWYCQRLIEKC